MKRFISLLLLLTISAFLFSCRECRPPRELLTDFIYIYGASGSTYFSDATELDDGYLPRRLLSKIYNLDTDFPNDFAIFLNIHAGYGAECGVFLCKDVSELSKMELSLCERMRLLDPDSDTSIIIRTGLTVFYSTMPDPDRVRKIWYSLV